MEKNIILNCIYQNILKKFSESMQNIDITQSERFFTLYYKYNDASLQLYVTDKSYSDNGFFQKIYRTEKNKPYIKSEYEERRIDNADGTEDRAFILNVIENQLAKPAVLTKK